MSKESEYNRRRFLGNAFMTFGAVEFARAYFISRKHQLVKKVFLALNPTPCFPTGKMIDEDVVGAIFPK